MLFNAQRLAQFSTRVGQEFKAFRLSFESKLGNLLAMPTADKTVAGAITEVYNLANAPVTANRIQGLLDPSNIPVQNFTKVHKSTASSIADLSQADQDALSADGTAGTCNAIRLATGGLLIYDGGSKTDEMSFTPLADHSPEWSLIEGKPSLFPTSVALVDGLAGVLSTLQTGINQNAQTAAAANTARAQEIAALEAAKQANEARILALETAPPTTWANISGKPATFPSTIAEVDGLPAQINQLNLADQTVLNQINNVVLPTIELLRTKADSFSKAEIEAQIAAQGIRDANQNIEITNIKLKDVDQDGRLTTLEGNLQLANQLEIANNAARMQAETQLLEAVGGQEVAIQNAQTAAGLLATEVSKSVRFDEQTLTASQQAQARLNIGAQATIQDVDMVALFEAALL